MRTDALLFGETQSRVVITCAAGDADAAADFFGILNCPCTKIGTVGGGNLKINDVVDLPLQKLEHAFFDSMPVFMEKVG